MSIIASYVTDDFLVIATDTRVLHKESPDPDFAGDNAGKLYQTEIGWGSGSGFYELINNFFLNLTQCSIKSSEDVRLCYNHTYLHACMEYPKSIDAINGTKVVFSYLTREDNKSFLRIGMLGKDFFDKNTGVLSYESLFVLWPDDVKESIVEVLNSKYYKLAQGKREINEIVFIISRLFKEVSSISRTVSGICDFGVTVLMDGSLTSFNIRDSAGNIEQACLSGTLDRYIKLY